MLRLFPALALASLEVKTRRKVSSSLDKESEGGGEEGEERHELDAELPPLFLSLLELRLELLDRIDVFGLV